MPVHVELDISLQALVEATRLSTESIWQSQIDERGEITVLLITDSAVEQAKRMSEIGLSGGEGRSLHFQKNNGTWSLKSMGKWIA